MLTRPASPRVRPCGRLPATALAAACALATCALAACAAPRPVPAPEPEPGAIAIHNATPDTLEVTLSTGRVVGLARGQEVVVAPVPAGPVTLEARNDALRVLYHHGVELAPGARARWDIQPEAATLVVVNPLETLVDVLLDGASLGRVAPGSERSFTQVPAGLRTVVARAVDAPFARQERLLLAAGEIARWELPLPAAARDPAVPAGEALLRMVNEGPYAVRVYLEDRELALVQPGERLELPIPPGAHELRARIDGMKTETLHRVEVSEGQVAEWRYAEGR